MVSAESKSVITRAKMIYEERLRGDLERTDRNWYVATEPESGDYFVSADFNSAVKLARSKHPTKISHVIHIGHAVAFHLGVSRS